MTNFCTMWPQELGQQRYHKPDYSETYERKSALWEIEMKSFLKDKSEYIPGIVFPGSKYCFSFFNHFWHAANDLLFVTSNTRTNIPIFSQLASHKSEKTSLPPESKITRSLKKAETRFWYPSISHTACNTSLNTESTHASHTETDTHATHTDR